MLVVYAVALWRAEPIWHDDVSAARGYVEGCPNRSSGDGIWRMISINRATWRSAEDEIRTALSLEPDRTGIYFIRIPTTCITFSASCWPDAAISTGQCWNSRRARTRLPDEDKKHSPRPPLVYNEDGVSLYNRGLRDATAGRTEQGHRGNHQGNRDDEEGSGAGLWPCGPALYQACGALRFDGNQQQVEAVLKEIDSMSEGELAAGLARARIRLNHSDQQGAERILRELSDRYPTDGKVLIQLANLEFELKQYKQALASYQRAGGGWFADADVHSSMAKSLHAMGRDREALDQCRLAEAMDPARIGDKVNLRQNPKRY